MSIAITFLAVLLLSGAIDGVLEIKWGASREQVIAYMKKRDGVTMNSGASNEKVAVFSGGEFAGMQVDLWGMNIGPKGFHTGKILLKSSNAAIISDYRKVKELLIKKYGGPEHDFYFFDSPYKEGDGYESTAIFSEKAHISAYWNFPVPNGLANTLSVSVNKYYNVVITYQNGELANDVIENQEKKALDDL